MLNTYKNIAEAKDALNKRGYVKRFSYDKKNRCCLANDNRYRHSDLSIIEHHRFQGIRDNSTSLIIVALEDMKGNKGILEVREPEIRDQDFIDFLDKVKVKLRPTEKKYVGSK